MAKKRTIKRSDSIHRASEYRASSFVAIASVIDVLISKLETTYANFPESVRRYATERGDAFWKKWEGPETTKGEQQHLNWLIAGLLKLMDEAKERGHTTDATRFAFEAGLLWSMSNHAQARKTHANIVDQLADRRRSAIKSRETEAKRISIMIRSEVETIRRGSPVPTTSTSARTTLSSWSHFADGTPMVGLRTINEAFASGKKRKPKQL